MNQVSFIVHLQPNDVKNVKVAPSSLFFMRRMRVPKLQKVVSSLVYISPSYNLVKVLYHDTEIELLCPLIP